MTYGEIYYIMFLSFSPLIFASLTRGNEDIKSTDGFARKGSFTPLAFTNPMSDFVNECINGNRLRR